MNSMISYPYRIIFVISILLVLILAAAGKAAPEHDQLFQAANESYSRGDYGPAIAQYEQLIAAQGYSAGLLYNLANSYAHNGQTGKAVLNYERALKLSPADAEILGNLQLLRNRLGLFPQEKSIPERFLFLLNLNQWTLLSSLVLLLLTAGLTFGYWLRAAFGYNLTLGCCGIVLLSLSAIAIRSQSPSWQAAVVISPKARLDISPFAGAASAGEIQAGRLVYPEKQHGDFSYVVDETGRKGWIATANIEAVIK